MRDPANKNLKQRPNGYWHFQRLKPTDLLDRLGGGKMVQIALGTDSLIEARKKRDQINIDLDAKWNALRQGGAEYIRQMEILPEKLDITGLPVDPQMREMILGPARTQFLEVIKSGSQELEDLFVAAFPQEVRRIVMIEAMQVKALRKSGFNVEEAGEAITEVVGETLDSGIKISAALEMFLDKIATGTTTKHSPAQKRGYENQKRRSVTRFIEVCGDLPLTDITRDHAIKFHDFWHKRIYEQGYSSGAGIKEMGDLSLIWSKVADRLGHYERNPFERLTFKEEKRRKQTYDRNWIASRWLQNDALGTMNAELRQILLMLVETGCNPSEILRLPLDRFRLQSKIPHILVDDLGDDETARGTVKTNFRIREIPLVGVALPAAQALHKAGGVQRYWDASGSFSAAANKFLRQNNLQQEKRTVGSLRHAVVEALKNDPAVSDDLRRAITGHKGNSSHESNYGRFSLDRKLEPLQRIALPFDPEIV